MRRRGFRDRDFLSTVEGFFFCVVGPYHPGDHVLSYLKYVPDPNGRWGKGRNRFRRVMQAYTIPNLLETFNLLRKSYPEYLFFSRFYNITMTAVPRERVVEHFEPERKLLELFKKLRRDSLQTKVVRLVSLLSKLSNVAAHDFGVTGSVLLSIHNPHFSDMDLTVYGAQNSYAVKDALFESLQIAHSGVRRLEKEQLREWCVSKTLKHPLTLSEARRVHMRKWNLGVFEDTLFSIHPIVLEEELTEKYGDKTYSPIRRVTVRAVVSDSRDSIFLPAVYSVAEVEGDMGDEIKEVVSYEGLYDSLAEKGDEIEVRGKLEHVIDNRTGREYCRVLVGSPEGSGGEYIKPVS